MGLMSRGTVCAVSGIVSCRGPPCVCLVETLVPHEPCACREGSWVFLCLDLFGLFPLNSLLFSVGPCLGFSTSSVVGLLRRPDENRIVNLSHAVEETGSPRKPFVQLGRGIGGRGRKRCSNVLKKSRVAIGEKIPTLKPEEKPMNALMTCSISPSPLRDLHARMTSSPILSSHQQCF